MNVDRFAHLRDLSTGRVLPNLMKKFGSESVSVSSSSSSPENVSSNGTIVQIHKIIVVSSKGFFEP